MPPPSDAASWDAVSPVYEAAIRRYAEEREQDPHSSATEATVRTNTELVPRRATDLLTILRALAGRQSIDGLRVLDLGSGWGSVSTYLAMTQKPARVVAVDVREDFVETASACSRAAGAENVEYVVADMTDLAPLQAAEFDVLLANNSLLYITSPGGLRAALRETWRVAAPGATLAIHQASKWQLRDPFTRDPLVHLLGTREAAWAGRALGWQGSSDRVRLVSSRQMRREVAGAGFEAVHSGVLTSAGQIRRRGIRGGRFFALAARKPG